MPVLAIIGYSIIALAGFVILAGVVMTWALSTLPEDTDE